jgi:hypothetical protein
MRPFILPLRISPTLAAFDTTPLAIRGVLVDQAADGALRRAAAVLFGDLFDRGWARFWGTIRVFAM